MSYEVTDYQGNKIILPNDKAQKIAAIAELIEVTVAGQTHYINPKNIASIKPVAGNDEPRQTERLLDRPDFRGRPSNAKEQLRQQFIHRNDKNN